MKKVMFAISIIALVFSCNTGKDVNYALISGKIKNPSSKKVMITKQGKKVKTISVAEDGTFKDTIFNADGYYKLGDSREVTPIYLENGYDINLTLDTKQFDETVAYTGKGKKPNNYLAKKFLKDEEEVKSIKVLYALEEDEFLKKLNRLKSDLEAELKLVGGNFVEKEQKALDYEYAMRLLNYEMYHSFITENKDFQVSDKFPNPVKGINLENEQEYEKNMVYRMLIERNFQYNLRKEAKATKVPGNELMVTKIKAMKPGKIRNGLLSSFLLGSIKYGEPNSKEMYEAIMELSTDENLKKETEKVWKQRQALRKGKPSPTFENYENYKGGTTSLKDFKGKYVYIDVWATWCGPCNREIPFMKKIEKKYHRKNIVFVSISVDTQKNKDKWKSMIKNKKMGGVQLIADKDFKSEFVQNYGINGIPRFIFIDKKGNIISDNAPRPSDPELIKLFKQYGL